MKKTYVFRLTAHRFSMERGFVSTAISMGEPRTQVEASSFPELETKIKEFGKANAPCNVWVGCVSKPKMRGFDQWNSGAAKHLFDAKGRHGAMEVCPSCEGDAADATAVEGCCDLCQGTGCVESATAVEYREGVEDTHGSANVTVSQ